MLSSPIMLKLHLRNFTPSDQATIRAMILAGFATRYAQIDETLNPDIDDIHAHYSAQGETFLVAEMDGQIIGCGALIRENGSDETARIVRVSVDQAQARRGIGRMISMALLQNARLRGFHEVLVETNDDWDSALRLYQGLGFSEYTRVPQPAYGYVEVHMRLTL